MVDVNGAESLEGKTTPRWRGLASLNSNDTTKKDSSESRKENPRPSIKPRDSDLVVESDVDISLIQKRTYLLSAGIGDTNKNYNKYKGKIGLVIWIINICIHFGLDFYEANTIFDISWATCIGLFLVTLVACCISMVKHSIPWFLKGVKKLKKDGNYPKTLKRVRLIVRFMPLIALVFAVGAAVGQFGCYWVDGALRVTFNTKQNATMMVSKEVETFLNVLRATSLLHIFYGFCSLLVFHMTLIFMIQSSMHEYNERMGKLFREVPISICFSDAVNLFSARAKFVRDGSQRSSVVLTTLLVACCTSFVLNAYNFLFLKKYAIYIWFALAPLIWAVVPLMGAAWVTKTYLQYKLVVVNAWVDIPDEHELEARAHASLHDSNSAGNRIKAPVRRMWGSIVRKTTRRDSDVKTSKNESDDKKTEDDCERIDEGKMKKLDDINEEGKVQKNKQFDDKKKAEMSNGKKPRVDFTATSRRNSEVTVGFSSKTNDSNQQARRLSSFAKVPTQTPPPPTILLTDFDGDNIDRSSPKPFRLKPLPHRIKDSSLINSSTPHNSMEIPQHSDTVVEVHDSRPDKNQNQEVCVDIEPISEDERVEFTQGQEEPDRTSGVKSYSNLSFSGSSSSSSLSSSNELVSEIMDEKPHENIEENSGTNRHSLLKAVPGPSEVDTDMNSLKVPGESTDGGPRNKANFLTGMSKTFHKWRTKTKKKKNFNYEKYIIYLESILPTVGFSVGGVIIDWNGIYTFIVIMTFLVGVFAQEAFFGN